VLGCVLSMYNPRAPYQDSSPAAAERGRGMGGGNAVCGRRRRARLAAPWEQPGGAGAIFEPREIALDHDRSVERPSRYTGAPEVEQ
jgi:hypothetical protein